MPFVVQRLVQGLQLDEYVAAKYPGREGKFCGIPRAADWFKLARELAERLSEVHQCEVVHRDIWRQNIMIEEHGTDICAVYIDFGEAALRHFLNNGHEPRKDFYVAPERRSHWWWPSRRSDVYALGGTLFFLATGKDPSAPIPDLDDLKRHVVDTVKSCNPDLLQQNAGVADVIARCLRFDPDNRIQDADNLLEELQPFFSLENATPLDEIVADFVKQAERLCGDPKGLFQLITAGELRKLRNRIESMREGVFDLRGDHEDIVSGLTRYLSVLDTGDEYLAVSVSEFWSAQNLGINGRFLTMNRLLAQRGVKIRRLFVVTAEELQPGSLFSTVARTHLEMQRELEQTSTIDNRFLVVSKEARDDIIRKSEHQGAWIRDGTSAMIIVPVYDPNMIMRAVRMRRYEGDPAHLRSQLAVRIGEGRPLEEAFPTDPGPDWVLDYKV